MPGSTYSFLVWVTSPMSVAGSMSQSISKEGRISNFYLYTTQPHKPKNVKDNCELVSWRSGIKEVGEKIPAEHVHHM